MIPWAAGIVVEDPARQQSVGTCGLPWGNHMMQDASRRIRWGAVVFGGDRYDIKYFKVVYRYTVLV